MLNAECLICDKNSTEIGYGMFPEGYPNATVRPEAQEFVGLLMSDIETLMGAMCQHAYKEHGISFKSIAHAYFQLAEPVETYEFGGVNFAKPFEPLNENGNKWLRITRINLKGTPNE